MLPGLAILGAAGISHPHWLKSLGAVDGWHIAILAAVALTVGNVWYVAHRYTLQQIIDYVIYALRYRKFRGYSSWLGAHINKTFHISESDERFRNHVHFRSAQIIFLFIIAEALIVFSIHAEYGTPFNRHWLITRVAGIALLLWCAVVQFPIGYSIDVFATDGHSHPKH